MTLENEPNHQCCFPVFLEFDRCTRLACGRTGISATDWLVGWLAAEQCGAGRMIGIHESNVDVSIDVAVVLGMDDVDDVDDDVDNDDDDVDLEVCICVYVLVPEC